MGGWHKTHPRHISCEHTCTQQNCQEVTFRHEQTSCEGKRQEALTPSSMDQHGNRSVLESRLIQGILPKRLGNIIRLCRVAVPALLALNHSMAQLADVPVESSKHNQGLQKEAINIPTSNGRTLGLASQTDLYLDFQMFDSNAPFLADLLRRRMAMKGVGAVCAVQPRCCHKSRVHVDSAAPAATVFPID